MRNKKLLSTLMATALVASTMTMPVMAEGAEITIPVYTKTAVLRVTVPTTIAIAVDQFEMADEGSQIYSGEFTMENNSAIGVKVGITSTATLKSTTKLVPTKTEATSNTAKSGEVWMAVASQTSANDYADGSAAALKDLTEANNNVTTFVQENSEGKAEQTYYFAKASTPAYKLLNASESAADIQYAQFYELTAQTVANANALTALLKDNDVYVAAGAAADGQTLTLVAKGGTHTWSGSEVYYIADQEATASINDTHTELFVYADGTADADGKGAFRYIGKLSGAQETWAKEDIPTVKIKYDIVGVDETGYNKVKDDCTYGLYKEPAPSYTETTAHGNWTDGTLWIGKDASTGFSSEDLTVEVSDGGTNYVELASDKYSVNEYKWVSTTWENITGALGGTPTGHAFIRITDGLTRYTFENQ